eukprot:scaffold3051_cov167-Ochromonas_danica.AAC.32
MQVSILTTLLCLPFLFSISSSRTVYLHVGPHKTGSTHIQTVLTALRPHLSKLGVCWAGNYIKSHHDFAKALKHNHPLNHSMESMTRIHSCLRHENIILSSETFDELDVASIRRLEEFLLYHSKSLQEGRVQIRVVAVYRDWFQRLFSAYVEQAKKSLSRLRSFSSFFTIRYDSAREGYGLDILEILQRYEEVFGLDALSLIDYAGAEAAEKDIAEKKRENESPPWKSYEVLVAVRDWAFRRGCSVNTSIDNMQGLGKLVSEYEGRIYEFPMRTSLLYPLRDLSDRIRRDFDDRYLLHTFYSNASADLLRRKSFTVELLDYNILFRNKSLLVELDNQVHNLMARGIFVDCDTAPQ